MGTCECESKHDTRWFHSTSRHCIFGLEQKKGSWHLHANLVISIESWALQHSEDVFFFPRCWCNQWDSSPIHHKYANTKSCESMLSYGHNGAISTDAAFGTNDMKFHLFTLMGFDDHHMGVFLTWIITYRENIWRFYWNHSKIKCYHICHIGNHHVFLLTMHCKNWKHYG